MAWLRSEATSEKFISAGECAARTSLSPRYFQKLFHSGKIDWGTQPGGPGSPILFRESGLNDWLEAGKKSRVWLGKSGTFNGVANTRTLRRSSMASGCASPLTRHLQKRLSDVHCNGYRN